MCLTRLVITRQPGFLAPVRIGGRSGRGVRNPGWQQAVTARRSSVRGEAPNWQTIENRIPMRKICGRRRGVDQTGVGLRPPVRSLSTAGIPGQHRAVGSDSRQVHALIDPDRKGERGS